MHFEVAHAEARNNWFSTSLGTMFETTFSLARRAGYGERHLVLEVDYNRNFSEPGWPEVPPEQQKNLWVRYTQNLYDILDRLRQKHPRLEIESCAGGGGRIDLGILRRAEQVWPSDTPKL